MKSGGHFFVDSLPCLVRSLLGRRAMLISAGLWATAAPMAAWAAAAPNGLGRPAGALPGYEIIKLGRGHNNRLCLAATINGVKGLFMLDTGANATALNESTYGSLLNASNPRPAGLPKNHQL